MKLKLVDGFGDFVGHKGNDEWPPEVQKLADELTSHRLKEVKEQAVDSKGQCFLSRRTISLMRRDFDFVHPIEIASKLAQLAACQKAHDAEVDRLEAERADLLRRLTNSIERHNAEKARLEAAHKAEIARLKEEHLRKIDQMSDYVVALRETIANKDAEIDRLEANTRKLVLAYEELRKSDVAQAVQKERQAIGKAIRKVWSSPQFPVSLGQLIDRLLAGESIEKTDEERK